MTQNTLTLEPQWPIGIFDSGLGGLTVLKAIQKMLPEEDLIYVADNKYLPYGGRSKKEIQSRSAAITEFLSAHPVKALVVACNTATAGAIQHLRENFTLPIIGVEPGVKPACQITQTGNIGVLATAGTLNSEKYENLRNLHGKNVEVFEQACDGLVQAIEDEYPNFNKTQELLKTCLEPFKNNRVDTVVLGCTHYPLVEPLIHNEMHSVVTINTGSAIARQLKNRLSELNLNNSANFSSRAQLFASQADIAFQEKVSRLLAQGDVTESKVLQLPEQYC